ncbi:cysteine desulfurase [Paraburkholderia silvatlantica]|uniref:Cysteine desulfurase n=1 Tax=Paraburkholderia silvatlantica TaxID=321895 RepID=A0ABR6FKK1_9BURK|nr:cysteine desulfurase [Paraburkholderia silvatlantica]MBB2927613.1 cysteine desulfurase/selenocysteine lyase [Paraburkholderia silvatlantica]PVY36323.1 L-selenocysteine selenide-lyase (L-alanine-forming) [Paraburkholderia silvatlantica]PXW40260.1 L-selenocysteine selenide-lyase (L-alanine-forming) [Paraburkholderia silvatlantica]
MNLLEPVGIPDTEAVMRWRRDFPILRQSVHGKPLVYLDNAATTQKPASVIAAEQAYYESGNANVHRGVHLLSQRATDAYEGARARIARFVHAANEKEIVYTRGTTEAINLVAQSYARPRLQPDDEVLITAMEHHSNIVPWQLVCAQTGAILKVAPIDDDGTLDLGAYERLLGPRTRIAAVAHASNALGTVNPLAQMIELAHARGVPVLVDGAQAIAHLPVDVAALDCDFYAFSGHKIYGPTGIGALYAKAALLDAMPPWQGGGDMIRSVTFEKTEYNVIPWRFEAGTPNIAGAIGLGAALDYVSAIGLEVVQRHEADLLAYADAALRAMPNVRMIGTANEKLGILSFVMDNAHAHDVGTILDQCGVAVRTGHHCAMPVMERYGVPATVRASFALYNTRAEVDALLDGLARVEEVFAP